jgi:capsular exopolysaccharide synthesis family protein
LNKTEKFTNTAGWLDRETRELKARVEESEQNLANYTRDHNLLSTDGKETLTNEKLARLHDQATRAETERILKESLYQEVKAGRATQLPEAFSDPKLGALQAKLGELAVTQAQLDTKYGPDHPKIIEVKQQMAVIQQQIDAGRGQLEEKLRADYERAVRDERSLQAALDLAKGEAVRQNQANIQFSLLKQDVETAKSMYTDFLNKTNQAKVQEAEQHNNMHLIESALPPVLPVGPNRLRTIVIGLFVSLLAGLGLTFFLEYLDSTIKSVEDVTRYAQLPALGVIPAISSRRVLKLAKKSSKTGLSLVDGESAPAEAFPGQLTAVDHHSSIAEAYRVLRTSVLLSTAGGPPKTILVTSGQPGDGKTTTIINTAVSLAQLGAKVLVIDCDMRRPSAHKILGVDYTAGLSTYLSRDIEIDGLIQKLPIANLSFLPSGPVPPNPAELLSSKRMKEMLALLAERYDHIMLDSPPLMLVTDPIVLSTIVDGVILVVQGGKSTREVVRRARLELAAVGAKVFGVVLNNLDMRRHGYDSYYYDRYYSEYPATKAEAAGE